MWSWDTCSLDPRMEERRAKEKQWSRRKQQLQKEINSCQASSCWMNEQTGTIKLGHSKAALFIQRYLTESELDITGLEWSLRNQVLSAENQNVQDLTKHYDLWLWKMFPCPLFKHTPKMVGAKLSINQYLYMTSRRHVSVSGGSWGGDIREESRSVNLDKYTGCGVCGKCP